MSIGLTRCHQYPTVRTFRELLDVVERVQGVPFNQLAKQLGVNVPEDPKKDKAFAGRVVEAAFGKTADNLKRADLHEMGIEIKTVPLGPDSLRPLENTKVGSLNPANTVERDWIGSDPYNKLRAVLFVPVVKYDTSFPLSWFIRAPFLWLPGVEELDHLGRDYEQVRQRLLSGNPDGITSKQPSSGGFCHTLIANTGGANSKDLVAFEVYGKEYRMKRRAWFLRKDFVQKILEENIG